MDLSPNSVDAAKDLKAKKPKLFIAALVLLGSLAGWWINNNRVTDGHQKTLDKLTKEYQGLKTQADAINAEQSRGDKAKAWADHLTNSLSGRQHWLDMLNAINKQFKDNNIWLTQISPFDANGAPLTDAIAEGDPVTVLVQGINTIVRAEKARPGAPDATSIDSIFISGLWRGENADMPRELFLKLKDLKDYFEIPDNWGDKPDEWLQSELSSASSRHASSFQMRLKLKNKLKVSLLPDRK